MSQPWDGHWSVAREMEEGDEVEFYEMYRVLCCLDILSCPRFEYIDWSVLGAV
jgi:hypothetical protein